MRLVKAVLKELYKDVSYCTRQVIEFLKQLAWPVTKVTLLLLATVMCFGISIEGLNYLGFSDGTAFIVSLLLFGVVGMIYRWVQIATYRAKKAISIENHNLLNSVKGN